MPPVESQGSLDLSRKVPKVLLQARIQQLRRKPVVAVVLAVAVTVESLRPDRQLRYAGFVNYS